jgi:hypothetical protein
MKLIPGRGDQASDLFRAQYGEAAAGRASGTEGPLSSRDASVS